MEGAGVSPVAMMEWLYLVNPRRIQTAFTIFNDHFICFGLRMFDVVDNLKNRVRILGIRLNSDFHFFFALFYSLTVLDH